MTFLRVIFLIILLLFMLCTPKNVKETAAFINSYYAKTIVLPDFELGNIGFTGSSILAGKDPASSIVVYTDGDCGKCIIDLLLWQDFIEEYQEELHYTQILFVAYSWHFPSFEQQLTNAGITLPHIFDNENRYIEMNDLQHSLLHSLLLDSNNNIVIVGSPLNNEKLTNLYLREIHRLTKDKMY